MNTEVILLVFLIVAFCVFVFRFIRLIRYYNEANSYRNKEDVNERRTAYTNFIIHLIVCIILLLSTGFLGFYTYSLMRIE